MKKVVVTGGAGFIGSHTVERLMAAGAKVLVIDDMTHACPEPPAAETLNADCGSEEAARAIADFKPDALLHLASKGGVQVAARDPAGHMRRSVASSVAVYDAAIKAGARRIVTASSGGTIYGDAKSLPARESFPAQPLSAYGAGKRSEEVYLEALGRRSGVSTLALRYGNVYGPRQDGTGEAGVIAITCTRLLSGQQPRIFGDGLQTRDFVFVGDIADANVLGLKSARSGALNVGTGKETSVAEVVDIIVSASGTESAIEMAPAKESEVRRVCLDPRRAGTWIRWHPRIDVHDGLRETWTWFAARAAGGAGARA
ncbi:MAG TPA: NAD-dependent epimerase/dehydratase family protein [Candidatus Dormibacteraeota bacterium]|nr:NAD-dependent epimerase/dehydratase family protein [Candidatus Dormibacteraeota bacterium]